MRTEEEKLKEMRMELEKAKEKEAIEEFLRYFDSIPFEKIRGTPDFFEIRKNFRQSLEDFSFELFDFF